MSSNNHIDELLSLYKRRCAQGHPINDEELQDLCRQHSEDLAEIRRRVALLQTANSVLEPISVADSHRNSAHECLNGEQTDLQPSQPTPTTAQNNLLVPGTKEWSVMNTRRAELIRKKNRQGLTLEEQSEYERLQNLSRAALDMAFPNPTDDGRLDRLEARLGAEE